MRTLHHWGFLVAFLLVFSGPAAAQFGRGPRPPQIHGVLNPVIGSGGVYQTTSGGTKSETEITLVGKEDVAGKTGYWLQIGINSAEAGGQMYMKMLMVIDGTSMKVSRMIVQAPGQGPMEMPASMIGTTPGSDVHEGQLVGTESVTTPGGTFNCQHYKAANGSWEAWINASVPPWGLVKSKDASGEMVLLRPITGARDRVTGTPQKLDFPGLGEVAPGIIPGR